MNTRSVAAVIHTPVFGGPYNQLLRLTPHLRKLGWDCQAIVPDSPGDGADRLSQCGIKVHTIPLHRLRARISFRAQWAYLSSFGAEIREIQRILKAEKIDVVQICGLMNPHGAIAAAREGIPVVWQLLSTFAPWPLRLFLSPLVRRYSTTIMSTGRIVFEKHPGLRCVADRLIPFYPPVDVEYVYNLRTLRDDARIELGARADQCVIGTVGNRCRQKGHQYLVATAAQLFESWQDRLRFRIAGRMDEANRRWNEVHVEHLVNESGVGENGFLKIFDPGGSALSLMPGFDIFVMSSIAEGVPTVILEAMSLGLPIIATEVGGVSEIVRHGENGFLVPPRNSKALAERCAQLAADRELRSRMGCCSLAMMRNGFGQDACISQHVRAFERTLTSGGNLSRSVRG